MDLVGRFKKIKAEPRKEELNFKEEYPQALLSLRQHVKHDFVL